MVTTLFLPDDHALWSGLLRALPSGLLLLAIGRSLPRGDWWWKALVRGILNIGAFFPLLFVAACLLPGGIAAFFAAANPLVIAALALPLLREDPTRWRLFRGVLAVACAQRTPARLACAPVGQAKPATIDEPGRR